MKVPIGRASDGDNLFNPVEIHLDIFDMIPVDDFCEEEKDSERKSILPPKKKLTEFEQELKWWNDFLDLTSSGGA